MSPHRTPDDAGELVSAPSHEPPPEPPPVEADHEDDERRGDEEDGWVPL